jgi:hypothetical protein
MIQWWTAPFPSSSRVSPIPLKTSDSPNLYDFGCMSRSYRLCKALARLREQINAAYPNRDKESDGWIGDAAHASRNSDHNPWVIDAKGLGVVTATDTDEDLSPGIHSIESIISAIRKSRDPRVKYIIYERRITKQGSDLQVWVPYHGINPHEHHAHISVKSDPRFYDDDHDWNIGSAVDASPTVSKPQDAKSENKVVEAPAASNGKSATAQPPILSRGSKGRDVAIVQTALVKAGYQMDPDGMFGENTDRAVRSFQKKHKLTVDGKVGPKTMKALGL